MALLVLRLVLLGCSEIGPVKKKYKYTKLGNSFFPRLSPIGKYHLPCYNKTLALLLLLSILA